MIITLLLQIASSFFQGLAGLSTGLATMPQGMTDAFGFVVNASNTLNYILPMGTLYTVLGVVLAVEAAIWLFEGAVWIYRHIPFIGH